MWIEVEAISVAEWHRQYNISGSVHCGGQVESGVAVNPSRLEDWCCVLSRVLHTEIVGSIGHFTGDRSVYAFSAIADVVSCGSDIHDFWAMVYGEEVDRLEFAKALESALTTAGLPYSLVIHESIRVKA